MNPATSPRRPYGANGTCLAPTGPYKDQKTGHAPTAALRGPV